MKNQTIINMVLVDGQRKVIEYDGDDLAGITKKLNDVTDQNNPLAAVRMKVIGPKGKIVFDKSFSYVPEEEVGA